MFKLDVSETYLWPVEFDLANGKGRTKKVKFFAEFNRLPQSRIDEINLAIRQSTDIDDVSLSDADIVDEVMSGWEDVSDGEGNKLDFEEPYRSIMLELPGARGAIVYSWFESLTGAPRKNSKRSPVSG